MKTPSTKMDKHNLGIKNRGDFRERTEWNSLEKAFADKWEELNKTSYGDEIDHLQHLFDNPGHFHNVSASERFVVATIVQWLGTNCGFSFLSSVLRKEGMRIVDVKNGHEVKKPTEDLINPYRRKF